MYETAGWEDIKTDFGKVRIIWDGKPCYAPTNTVVYISKAELYKSAVFPLRNIYIYKTALEIIYVTFFTFTLSHIIHACNNSQVS